MTITQNIIRNAQINYRSITLLNVYTCGNSKGFTYLLDGKKGSSLARSWKALKTRLQATERQSEATVWGSVFKTDLVQLCCHTEGRVAISGVFQVCQIDWSGRANGNNPGFFAQVQETFGSRAKHWIRIHGVNAPVVKTHREFRVAEARICPCCGIDADGLHEVQDLFGFRKLRLNMVSQSLCKGCRGLSKAEREEIQAERAEKR